VQGNIIVNQQGEKRINIKECYPLANFITGNIRKVTWLLRPAHPQLPALLREIRAAIDQDTGDTKTDFAFLFEDRVAPIAEASTALGWKLTPAAYRPLRAHPALAGVLLEPRPLHLKQDLRWKKRD